MINEYGRLNDVSKLLNARLKQQQELHLNLTDAGNEILLSDDDMVKVRATFTPVPERARARVWRRSRLDGICDATTCVRLFAQVLIGEAFFTLPKDEAEARLEAGVFVQAENRRRRASA